MAVFSHERVKRALLSLCVSFPLLALAATPLGHDAHVLWVTIPGSILKVSADDGSVALEVAFKDADALAVDPVKDSIWVLKDRRLFAYDGLGNILVNSVDLRHTLHETNPNAMAVDDKDGILWISVDDHLYKLDLQGNVQADYKLGSDLHGLS